MKLLRWITTSAAIAAVALTAAMPAAAREFRIGLITPPPHLWTLAAQKFAEDLKTASGGKLTAAVFPAAQLGNEAQMLQQLQTGALDMALLTIGELTNRAPNFGALYAPYLVTDVTQAGALLRHPSATKLLLELPRAVGVVGVGFGMGGMRQILSRSPVQTVDDLKGKKLRITPVDPIKDFYNAIGAASTPMPLSSVFDALSNGQVDAIDMDLEVIWALKFYQNASTILLSNHMMFPMVGVVSGKVWAKLKPDERKQITELMNKRLAETIDAYVVKEAEWEKQLRGTRKSVVKVGPEFFSNAIEQWNGIWSRKAKALAELRQAAQSLPKSP